MEVSPDKSMILVVEDNDSLRRQLRKHLQGEYNVITASNGVEGVAMTLREHPVVVITDVMMPEMDGIEMCRQIKCNEEVSHTPILVLTANSTVKCQIDSYTIGGADGYLDKPFNIDVLRSKIKAILQNRELVRHRYQTTPMVTTAEIARTPTDQKYLKQILEIIDQNMSNSEFSIELLAKEYGVSRVYLSRKIKALTGETSAQFIRTFRLKRAAEFLASGEMNVSEAAWAVGYSDIDTFRSRFKEQFGMNPSTYIDESR